ncbi:hypothetical protein CLF_105870, partial [Clonorchis sinensis]
TDALTTELTIVIIDSREFRASDFPVSILNTAVRQRAADQQYLTCLFACFPQSSKLLEKNQKERLHGCDALQRSEFFKGHLDFDAVEKQQYDPGIFFTDDDVVRLPDCSLKRQIQAIKRRSSHMSANGTKQPNRRRCNRSQGRKSIIRVSDPSDGVNMNSVSGPSESTQAPSDSSFQFRSNSKLVVSGTESANTNAPETIRGTVNDPSLRKDASIRVVRIPAAKVLPQQWDCARNLTRPIQHKPDPASSDSASLTSQRIRSVLNVSKQRHSYTNSVTDLKSVESPFKSSSRTDVRFMSDRQRRMSISGSRPVKIVHLLRRGESLRGLSRLSIASQAVRQRRPSLYQIVRELPVDGPQFRGLRAQSVVDSAPHPKLTTDRIFIWRPG